MADPDVRNAVEDAKNLLEDLGACFWTLSIWLWVYFDCDFRFLSALWKMWNKDLDAEPAAVAPKLQVVFMTVAKCIHNTCSLMARPLRKNWRRSRRRVQRVFSWHVVSMVPHWRFQFHSNFLKVNVHPWSCIESQRDQGWPLLAESSKNHEIWRKLKYGS